MYIEGMVRKRGVGESLRDIILGGQDGIVNILGLVLGVAMATASSNIVIIAGLTSMFAESFSMAAVAFSSVRASHTYYDSMYNDVKKGIATFPAKGKKSLEKVYKKKGFSGSLLDRIVNTLMKKKKLWVETLLRDELKLEREKDTPSYAAWMVGCSSLIGSFIPLIPFFLLPIHNAIITAIVLSLTVLFITGVVRAKSTVGTWWKSGLELVVVGGLAALAGYVIGWLLSFL